MGKLRFWWELGTEDLWASFSCLQSSISLPYGGVVRICVLKIVRCPDLGVKKSQTALQWGLDKVSQAGVIKRWLDGHSVAGAANGKAQVEVRVWLAHCVFFSVLAGPTGTRNPSSFSLIIW